MRRSAIGIVGGSPTRVLLEIRLFAGGPFRFLSREVAGGQGVLFQCRQCAALAANLAVHGLPGVGSGAVLTGNVDAGGGFGPGFFLGFIHDWDAIGAGRLRNFPHPHQ